jgi:hypothetical protein
MPRHAPKSRNSIRRGPVFHSRSPNEIGFPKVSRTGGLYENMERERAKRLAVTANKPLHKNPPTRAALPATHTISSKPFHGQEKFMEGRSPIASVDELVPRLDPSCERE